MAKERVSGKEALVRVAVVQMEPVIGDKEANLAKSVSYINAAADNGATLIVLPELCNTGWVLNDREEAFSLAEPVPDGPTTKSWVELAAQRKVFIVAGITEREGPVLYNSSVLIGPEGYIGTYRKTHLWGQEKLFFEPGNLGFPVFYTPLGRIAMLICYDAWFPEAWRLCALKGADIVCTCNNWVPTRTQPEGEKPMANYVSMVAANVNSIFVAAADRIGVERGQPFIGQSIIVAPSGWIIAGPASVDKEEILYADCNLAGARKTKSWGPFNMPLRDRRQDIYDVMLGADEVPFPW
ncbi:MAG TPA: hydratase [Firmicutes bacterium]|nr:hydratase [Bacillota bacterium]